MPLWTREDEQNYLHTLEVTHFLRRKADSLPLSTALQQALKVMQEEVGYLRRIRREAPLPPPQKRVAEAIAGFSRHLWAYASGRGRDFGNFRIIPVSAKAGTFRRRGETVTFHISPLWECPSQWFQHTSRFLLKRRRCEEGWEATTGHLHWDAHGPVRVSLYAEAMIEDPLTHKLHFGLNFAVAKQRMEAARADELLESL